MSSSGPRPPLASAIGLSLVLAVFMAWLRFVIFPDAIVPLAYDLALLVALWHRHRVVHWSLATALVAMATFKIHFVVPDAALAGLSRWAVWSMQIVSMSFVAAVIEIINLLRRRLENRSRALDETNAELEAANEELTSREAEISVQNEQLQQQASELEQQAEELESHTEDLRGVNESCANAKRSSSVCWSLQTRMRSRKIRSAESANLLRRLSAAPTDQLFWTEPRTACES